MDMKRRIALASALLAVGLGAGHFVQSRAKPAQQAALAPEVKPQSVVPLAATIEPALPEPVKPALPAAPALEPAAKPETAPAPVADACPVELELMQQDNAMVGITLLAPCRPGQRLVIKHGGLAITAQTSTTGSLFLDIPAMETQARIDISFPDGEKIASTIPMPEVAQMQRFAVQWLDRDAFQLHAFENGADYGKPGHVSAAAPQRPAPGEIAQGGFLTLLGDATTDLPMLAEVYTFPKGGTPEVLIESAVTADTCGRELLGETIGSVGGKVSVNELTLAMPECDAAGDILVLKNLVPEMKLAAR